MRIPKSPPSTEERASGFGNKITLNLNDPRGVFVVSPSSARVGQTGVVGGLRLCGFAVVGEQRCGVEYIGFADCWG